jgi:CheY-like chemotaxis protein
MNLCTNAYHAMRKSGGELEVTLSQVDIHPGDMESGANMKPGPHLKLRVRDTGEGMDASVMERIFDPYFTTKAPGEGTGMGLAVVHGIVKSNNGDIKVRSKPGKGTTFEILIPVVDTTPPPSIALPAELPRGKEEWVLLVDDEAHIVTILQQSLERLGYRITAKASSLAALEEFMKHPKEFDAVITDQTMPQMTGAELSRALLKLNPEIPIILCTGFSEMISEETAKAIGIREYIMKPIMARDLSRVLRKVLDSR